MNVRGTMRGQLGVLAVVCGSLALTPSAAADGGSLNYRSKLISVAPGIKGLTVTVVDGDDAVELRNATGKNVLIPGYENEPYLRFLTSGRVEVNVNSPAKYLNEERYGGVKVPKEADAKAKPRWQLVAQGHSYVWHDHRIHWMSTDKPPQVKDAGKLTKVFDWVVPIGVGGVRVKASGTLWWVPTGQRANADALIAAALVREAETKQAEETTAAEPAPATETSSAAPTPAAPASSESSSVLLWVVIGVLALALAGAGAYVFRLRRRGNSARPAGEAW